MPVRSPLPRLRAALGDRVVLIGLALIVGQLLFRGWALSRSWFYFDDLAFMSRAFNQPLDASYLTESYGGHLMPGGFLVTWLLANGTEAFDWTPWAGVLLGLQALADIGMLRLLLSMFGRRRSVLALLTGYLVLVTSLPAFIWFAAGINQLPLQIALGFGTTAHVAYLRTQRLGHAVAAMIWTTLGLAFYEKTLLVFAVYGIVALGYFASGSVPERLRALWAHYRRGVVIYGVVALGYLALYSEYGWNVDAQQANSVSWSPIAYNMVLKAFASAAIGGPFTWRPLTVGSIADPSDLTLLVAWAALAALVAYSVQTRRIAGRAWWIVGLGLLANVSLVATGRAFLVGPDIALEYRYQSESSALLMLSLGLAYLPLRGALELNEAKPDATRPYETPRIVTATVALVSVAAMSSSQTFVDTWAGHNPTRGYLRHVRSSLAQAPSTPIPVADGGIPQTLLWSYRYPENTFSHVLKPYSAKLDYVSSAIDNLYVFDDTGQLRPALVTDLRTAVPPPSTDCGYDVGSAVEIPLTDRVIGGGWWLRFAYHAESTVRVTVTAGQESHDLTLTPGLHNAFVTASGEFTSFRVTRSDAGNRGLCVTDASLGLPVALGAPS